MPKNALITTAALLLGVAIGAAAPVLAEDKSSGPPGVAVQDPDATVTAHRYEMVVFDSAMDFVHAAGRTIIELHFPDSGIVCNVAEAQMQNVVMSAFYGERRDVHNPKLLEMLGDDAPKQAEPEVIEVPIKLYTRIQMLAEITRDRAEYAAKLKADLAAAGLFQMKE
jgi:hypothetical protein